MDEPAGTDVTTEDFHIQEPASETEPEGEDFLLWLTAEERECLQYLLETIKSLEEDLTPESTEDGPGGECNSNEHREQTPEGNHECNRSTIIGMQSRLQLRQMSSGESERDVRQIAHLPNETSVKLSKPLSDDCAGDYVTTAQENLNKLVNMNPSYLRKFDTIMKSGVSVQELRARFVAPQVSSAMEEENKAMDTSCTSKKVLPIPGGHTSPREKALQKLGLLKRNQAILTTSSSPDGFFDQHQTPSATVKSAGNVSQATKELGSCSSKDTAEPLSPSDDLDHQEALKKLGFLHL